MNMIKHEVVLKHHGENADTPHDVYITLAEAKAANLALDCKVWRCMNAGMDMPVEINLYRVAEIELPEWMPIEDYIASTKLRIDLKYYVGFGGKLEWGREVFNKFRKLESLEEYIAIKLYASKPRAEFRKAMKEKVIEWLNDAGHLYPTPFSFKMLNALANMYVKREHKGVSDRLYRDRREAFLVK